MRNVFALKPPPPPPDPESLKPPPQKITLTGIMTIFGKKQALMKTPPTAAPPPKPGETPKPPQEHSYMLTEGQREDEITVLEIDEKAHLVKVDNSGTVQTLTFTNDAPKVAGAAGPAGPGGVPGGGFRASNPMVPAGAAGGMKSIPLPGRPLRLPGMNGSSSTDTGGAVGTTAMTGGAQPAGYASGASTPYAVTSAQTAPMASGQQQTASQGSVEESVLLSEVNRLRNEQLRTAGARLPPYPRHPLAAGLDDGSAPAPAPTPVQQPMARPGMPQLPQ